MPAIGLDISDKAIRFADLERKGTAFRLKDFGEELLAKDVIEEGEIVNKDELTKALARLSEKHRIQFVKASLPEEKAYLFRTELPKMDYGDVRGALRFKLEENVPVPIQDAVFDYSICSAKPGSADTAMEVSVAVVSAKVASAYIEVLTAAKLIPVVFQIESQSIARAVVPAGDEQTYIVIAVRETKTVLAIVSESVIQYSTTLSVGGQSLVSSIKKNFSVSEAEAQKIRLGAEPKEGSEMFQSLIHAASVVRDEIQKLLVYWDSRDEGRHPVKEVIICGSDALLGLDDYLVQSIALPVRIANVWTNIAPLGTYLPPITKRESLDYASALGLALPYD